MKLPQGPALEGPAPTTHTTTHRRRCEPSIHRKSYQKAVIVGLFNQIFDGVDVPTNRG